MHRYGTVVNERQTVVRALESWVPNTICPCGHVKQAAHGEGGCYTRVDNDVEKWCPCTLDWGQTGVPR